MATLYYPPEQNGLQKTLDAQLDSGHTTAMTLNNTTNVQDKPGVVVVNRIDSSDSLKDASDREYITYTGTSGATLTGLTRNADSSTTDQDHAVGSIVEFIPDVIWAQAFVDQVKNRDIVIQVEEGSVGLSTGDGQAYVTIPSYLDGANLNAVHARVITAPTGANLNIQFHNVTDSVDMLSTVLSIDATETGSDTATTAAVIDTANDDIATNDLIRIDIDQVGSTVAGKGLVVRLQFQL